MHFASVVTLLGLAACALADPWYPRPNYLRRATFARWLVHESNSTIVATSSQQYSNIAYPNLMATSDGTGPQDCTGEVYIYVANISTIVADIRANPRVTFGFFETVENDKYCTGPQYDEEDPNCGKVHLTGTAEIVAQSGDLSVAEKYLFWRHPAMASWPGEHGWLTISLNIETVDVLDFYGSQVHLTVDEYKKATCH
eukprot:TRINITY_DN8552_c0_g2_i1.p1 TRINITY_DN8552_c0_g2~~TRINITY_DN8552_c0_g2_i1.p1  ORF type:complete len:215 (+),score=86.91 TRINITY_DN8552_c0_g2_i1:53-646(+)